MPLPAAAAAQQYDARYAFHWSGIPVGTLDLSVDEDDTTYTAEVRAKSAGLARLFSRHDSRTEVSGIRDASGYRSLTYDTRYLSGSGMKRITLRYEADGTFASETLVPERESSRPFVAADSKFSSRDLITTMLEIGRLTKGWIGGSTPASATLQVYDGKRLFALDVRLIDQARTVHVNDKPQSVVVVEVKRRPLAGYTKKEQRKFADGEPPLFFYFDPVRFVPQGVSVEAYGAQLTGWIRS